MIFYGFVTGAWDLMTRYIDIHPLSGTENVRKCNVMMVNVTLLMILCMITIIPGIEESCSYVK